MYKGSTKKAKIVQIKGFIASQRKEFSKDWKANVQNLKKVGLQNTWDTTILVLAGWIKRFPATSLREGKQEENSKLWKNMLNYIQAKAEIDSNPKHICKVPYVAGKSEVHSGRDYRQSVHVHYRQCQTAQFSKYAWKCWEAQRIDIYTTVSSRLKER